MLLDDKFQPNKISTFAVRAVKRKQRLGLGLFQSTSKERYYIPLKNLLLLLPYHCVTYDVTYDKRRFGKNIWTSIFKQISQLQDKCQIDRRMGPNLKEPSVHCRSSNKTCAEHPYD